MDHIVIKEEIEDNDDAGVESHDRNSSPTPYSSSLLSAFSSSLSTPISSLAVPPTKRVTPSTLPASRQGLNMLGIGGYWARDLLLKEPSIAFKSSVLKRKSAELDPNRFQHARYQPTLLSSPLVPSGPSYPSHISTIPRYSHSGASTQDSGASTQDSGASTQDSGASQDEEWRNIKVMLNCISGMVEKTQSAISILQQKQAEVANVRMAQELVKEVESKASMCILEVKQAALEEIKKTKSKHRFDIQNDSKDKCCWNCGRTATLTCSVCTLARYCGPFCQHKDWEDHARVCRVNLIMEDISSKQSGLEASTIAMNETVKME